MIRVRTRGRRRVFSGAMLQAGPWVIGAAAVVVFYFAMVYSRPRPDCAVYEVAYYDRQAQSWLCARLDDVP